MKDGKIRLQKVLADAGIASRRKAEELIVSGKIKVNGTPAILGDKVNPRIDCIEVLGEKVKLQQQAPVYLALHKPRGYVTTMRDERGRKCITELISDIPVRVYPVGRLDKNSEGLLLLTNDGQFANRMMHPSSHVPKTYRVTVRPSISDEQIFKLSEGMVIDGKKTAPAEVQVLSKHEGRVVLQIVLYEGKKRQIRKMCEQLGLEVARLKRVAIGPVKLGMLPPGRWRELNEKEMESLNLKKDRQPYKALLPKRRKGKGKMI